jgi:carboxypeptidase Taq
MDIYLSEILIHKKYLYIEPTIVLSMFKNQIILEILNKYRYIWSLESVNALMDWDLETYMPAQGIDGRAEAIAYNSLLKQNYVNSLKPLIDKAEKESELNDDELAVIRVLKRDIHYYTTLPPKFIESLNNTITKSNMKWRESREKSDFSIFKPYLERIVELSRKKADYLGYRITPYNALLDIYTEELTVSDLDNIFPALSAELITIKNKVVSENYFPIEHPLEHIKYDLNAMKDVNLDIIKLLEMPTNKFRIDVSSHPFTTKISPNDVRITTRYEGVDFKKTMYSTIHECGHAIYSLQQDPNLSYTPIAHNDSKDASTEVGGISESQSRFWENVVGRSRSFVNNIYPILKSRLSFVSKYSEEDIYKYVNTVKPSFIRVDADEITYNLHIILRYNIEKDLISGKINVSELPTVWNDMMEKMIGLRPKNDREGVLQDTHWGNGMFGYFPTYSLGNIVAAMIWFKLKDNIENMTYSDLKQWLYENIHKVGKIYTPKKIQERIFGESFNAEKLTSYLNTKYINLR